MKTILRAALFLVLLMALVTTTLLADEKENENAPRQGTVRGRIIDNESQNLPGASIYIEKLQTGMTSDVNGFYTLSNIEPGTYTVKVTYVGYAPVEMKLTIPADMIQTIEVNKVVTPDMDADAIGGSINLVTKNSPYKRFITATAVSGYNWVSDKAQLNLGFTYGQRFFGDRLGVMLCLLFFFQSWSIPII